jgi:hypothetical protein
MKNLYRKLLESSRVYAKNPAHNVAHFLVLVVVGALSTYLIVGNINQDALLNYNEMASISVSTNLEQESTLNLANFEGNFPKDPDGKDQNFKKFTTDTNVIFFSQRMIDGAVVEKDQSVYVFDKSNGKLKEKKISHRSGLPEHLSLGLISKDQAESSVSGSSKFSTLYYASPNSDIFNIDFNRSNPIWAVTSFNQDKVASLTIIDATTGKKLGNGVPPPSAAYSITGPTSYGSSCGGSWNSWSDNAANWYTKMGYATHNQVWPQKTQEMSDIQNPDAALFYELAHGNSNIFVNDCTEYTYSSDIHDWLASYPGKQFVFMGSCDGLCDVGPGSFAYEFRKGSDVNTAAIGYCGMGSSACGDCWNYSLNWQDKLFSYINQGYTVKSAFDKANTDYPTCAVNNCMRFTGDPNFTINNSVPDSQAPKVSITSPVGGAVLSGNNVTVLISASDNIGVAKVELYKDEILINAGVSSPYQFTWNTTADADGGHRLLAKAYDIAGNIGSSTLVNVTTNNTPDAVAPLVSITYPTNGAIISGNVSIKAFATDNIGVVSMKCYVDNKLITSSASNSISCSWNTNKAAKGAHVINVSASDVVGNSGSSSIGVTVNSNSGRKK